MAQMGGDDAIGSNETKSQVIGAEIVKGRAEAIYWENVPSKIKLAALQRLSNAPDDGEQKQERTRKRRRKA